MRDCPSFEDLSAFADGQLEAEAQVGLRLHLGACPSCALQVQNLTALKQAVARAYETRTPAPALRLAVLRGRRRPRLWASRPWGLAAAAVLLLAVGAALLQSGGNEPLGTFSAALVDQHVRSLSDASRLEVALDDPAALSAWFSARLSYPVSVRALPHARLLGGRRGTILGQPAAVAYYERNGGAVSRFYSNAAGVGEEHPLRASLEALQTPECRRVEAYRVCVHREGDLLVGMVSPRHVPVSVSLPTARTS